MVVGFCIGGTLLTSALAVLAKKKRKLVESLTLMTALLEFTEVGEIRVYVDENFVACLQLGYGLRSGRGHESYRLSVLQYCFKSLSVGFCFD